MTSFDISNTKVPQLYSPTGTGVKISRFKYIAFRSVTLEFIVTEIRISLRDYAATNLNICCTPFFQTFVLGNKLNNKSTLSGSNMLTGPVVSSLA